MGAKAVHVEVGGSVEFSNKAADEPNQAGSFPGNKSISKSSLAQRPKDGLKRAVNFGPQPELVA